jgi:hypothetical protein
MKIRVSYYKESEVEQGRAPRYVKDVEGDSVRDGVTKVIRQGFILRSAYKAPNAAIIRKKGFIYMSDEAKENWNNKQRTDKPRLCKTSTCNNPAEPYRRRCKSCDAAAKSPRPKLCVDCGEEIPSNHRLCEGCVKKKEIHLRRVNRSKKTLARLQKQMRWAHKLLAKAKSDACINATFYQGLRFPQCFYGNPCRCCLNVWLRVQTEYQKSLLKGNLNPLRPDKSRGRAQRNEPGKVTMQNYKSFGKSKAAKA